MDWEKKEYSLNDILHAMDNKGVNGTVVGMCKFLGVELWAVDSDGELTTQHTPIGEELARKCRENRDQKLKALKEKYSS